MCLFLDHEASVNDSDDDDDVEYFRQEVGEEPEPGLIFICFLLSVFFE